jgi:hypothetical protein
MATVFAGDSRQAILLHDEKKGELEKRDADDAARAPGGAGRIDVLRLRAG